MDACLWVVGVDDAVLVMGVVGLAAARSVFGVRRLDTALPPMRMEKTRAENQMDRTDGSVMKRLAGTAQRIRSWDVLRRGNRRL